MRDTTTWHLSFCITYAVIHKMPENGDEHFVALEKPTFPRSLDIVYAGGDDSFIVGAWDQLIEAAFDIHRAFGKFSRENPHLHTQEETAL